MDLKLRWVGKADIEAVAAARAQSYAVGSSEIETYRNNLNEDRRAVEGDYLLAEEGSHPVGTATIYRMRMWVRGAAMPCQGVGFVGTDLTRRRSQSAKVGKTIRKNGIASQLMFEMLDRARKDGDVVSALMPFRASFYEHFGYGVVERRNAWTVPITVLPQGPYQGLRLVQLQDLPALERCKERIARAGQCDMERSREFWNWWLKRWDPCWIVVDPVRAKAGNDIQGWLNFTRVQENGKSYAQINDMGYDCPETLRRLLNFLASLKDQYYAARLILPADLQLTRLLHEGQIPHRPVNHATAEIKQHTRMQLRILDHKRFLEALKLCETVGHVKGEVRLAIRECEGSISRMKLCINKGRIRVMPGGERASTNNDKISCGALQCHDYVWASIACGDLKASEAIRWGLARETLAGAANLLDVLSAGPAPFTAEYF